MEALINSLPAEGVVALGAVVGIGLLVRAFGLTQGMKISPDNSSAAAQVVALSVDNSVLKMAVAAIEAQTMEMTDGRKTQERAVDDIVDRMRDLTRSIDALREELIRRGR